MITEDYVSFEVAELLKEKGFPQSTFRCHYLTDGNSYYKIFENRCGFGDNNIVAPTLAMTIKWLREVYNIYIVIHPYTDTEGHNWSFIFDKFAFGGWQELGIYITDSWSSYEEAAEAGIKYCLENLI